MNPNSTTTFTSDRLFQLNLGNGGPFSRLVAASLEKLTSLSGLNRVYQRVAHAPDRRQFLLEVLKDLRICCSATDGDLERIPRKGPVVVVANHPFGAIEGIILAELLTRVRPDVKIMANYLLERIPELRDLFCFVDPFDHDESVRGNLAAMRQSLKHLENGGLLVIFPAGEVSSLDLRKREVTDKPWTSMVGRIVRRFGASVVPVFFNGHNGALFQIAGLINPKLRTALLPRQLLNKRDRTIDVRIGSTIHGRTLKEIGGDQQLTDYLRRRTYMLRHRGAGEVSTIAAQAGHLPARVMRPVAPIGDIAAMELEIKALPASARLVESDDNLVFVARAHEIPNLMKEIGRLREITFRAAGEGTGKSLDLDQFDSHYLHLIVWNIPKREMVGSYRLGASDEILAERGVGGLYTYELFDYRPEMLQRMGPSLELGRSFIRAEYQRSYTPLLLLWKGIGQFLVNNPRYRYLFGPVSISGAYQSTSVKLMVQFLKLHHGDRANEGLVNARTPFEPQSKRGWEQIASLARTEDELSDLVSDLEVDQKGVPVLIRQYIKLGAKFLSFNVDHSFGDCVDGLIVVDLLRTVPKVLERYLGKDGLASYLSHWQLYSAS